MHPGYILLILFDGAEGTLPGVYTPSVDFSDARNSFYRAMGL